MGECKMGGKLLIAGGGLEENEKKIHKKLIELAGGIENRLAIIPTASGEAPVNTIKNVEDIWLEIGMKKENIVLLPIFGEEGKGWREPPLGDEENILKLLEGVTGVWFTGGDQYYTHKAFIRKDGAHTKALSRLKEIYEKGGVIGGTSAGAAIMSEVMIASGNNMNALNLPPVYGYEDYDDSDENQDYVRIVKGLGFFTEGVIDQHFDRRPRILRLIKAITDSHKDLYMGYGVSEDTAMIYDRDTKDMEVIGGGAVYIVDCSKIEKSPNTFTTFKNVTFHVIKEGDMYNHQVDKLILK